ncbi:MAG: Increased rDNA silencing protein [Icmadophila ericetorum]|nr:Increased rDNA silencing protein [Icmadophila ericetorum]
MNVTTSAREEQAGLDTRNRSSAVTGASAAFRNLQAARKPTSDASRSKNAALAAASIAGVSQRLAIKNGDREERPSRSPRSPMPLNRAAPNELEESRSRFNSHLGLPNKSRSTRQSSPSHIAATLAAARSNPSIAVKNTANSSPGTTRSQSPASLSSEPPSAPVTNALVNFFEAKSQPLKSQDVYTTEKGGTRRSEISDPSPTRPPISFQVSPDQSTSQQNPVKQLRRPPDAGFDDAAIDSTRDGGHGSNVSEYIQNHPNLPQMRSGAFSGTRQSLIPPIYDNFGNKELGRIRHSGKSSAVPSNRGSPSIVSDESQSLRKLPDRLTGHPPMLPLQLSSTAPPVLSPVPSRPLLQQLGRSDSTPNLRATLGYQKSVDNLANAMVASSLASSRSSSPTKPALPRRQSRPVSLIYQSYVYGPEVGRASSPSKMMRTTLREPTRKGKDKEPGKRNHLIYKHPNKHNEGDRKRWRDEITDKERKRYEGVWAANRGILIPSSENQDQVHSLVVRDIWRRSQLSSSLLAEVWNLLDSQNRGMLNREEFVVGMWLIDQCLKGRKLPVRVSESVWSSVRRLTGIVIPGIQR